MEKIRIDYTNKIINPEKFSGYFFIYNSVLKTKRTLPFYTHYSRLRKRIKFLQKPSETKAFSENFYTRKTTNPTSSELQK